MVMKKGLVLLASIISDGCFHSGQELASRLNVSRAAIWKSIKQLQELGLPVQEVRGKGYCLTNKVEFLSEQKIKNLFSPLAKQSCRKLEILFNPDSTNSYLLEKLRTEEIHGNVVLAESQSNGRGRRGNKWLSPLGSGLYLSVAWRFLRTPNVLGLLSLYIGVAIVHALESSGIDKVALKWPNDILVQNGKLGGVLIDIKGEAGGPVDVIIGVGINYNMPEALTKEITQSTTDIYRITAESLSERPSRNQIMASLLSSIFEILEKIDMNETSGLLDEWRRYDCFMGKPARLVFQQDLIEGVVKGVDEQGSLLSDVDGNIQCYTSGDLSLRLK